MSYKVEYLHENGNVWTSTGTHSSEQTAIFNARTVAKRSRVTKVRVIDGSGSVVWMS